MTFCPNCNRRLRQVFIRDTSNYNIPSSLFNRRTALECIGCGIYFVLLPNSKLYAYRTGIDGASWTLVSSKKQRKYDPSKIIGGVFVQ
jgi:hypothetical protein